MSDETIEEPNPKNKPSKADKVKDTVASTISGAVDIGVQITTAGVNVASDVADVAGKVAGAALEVGEAVIDVACEVIETIGDIS